MKYRLTKLIDVKSIVTIIFTVMFCILAERETISGEQFMTLYTMIIGFYFGTQFGKNGGDKNE